MNRLEKIFAENEKINIVPVCCGAPDMIGSEARIEDVIAAGAGIVELAVPFSDPMSGTPDVQLAFQQAIAAGANLSNILPMIKRVRQRNPETALILSGYCNVFLQYGAEKLFCELKMLAVDAVLVFDLPYEEMAEFAVYAEKYSVDLLHTAGKFTSAERAKKIYHGAKGFIYCLDKISPQELANLRSVTDLPIAVQGKMSGANAFIFSENTASMPIAELKNLLAI